MASALNEVLTPARFDTEPNSSKAATEPNSSKAAKQLKNWLNVFIYYLEKCERLADA